MKDADLAVILTDHKIYQSLEFGTLAETMRVPQLFDTRNMIPVDVSNKLTVINYGNLYQYKK